MNQHWTQVASKANIKWLRKQIHDQKEETLSLRRLTSFALTNRGISKEKLFVYLEALEASDFIIVNIEKQIITKLIHVTEQYEPQSKL